MSNTKLQDPYTRLPIGKRLARGILYSMYKVLPGPVYNACYLPAFQTYQFFIWANYRRKLAQARWRKEHDAAVRMERVLSVMPYSLISPPGLEHTHDLAVDLVRRQVPGCFVECGIAQGGSAALIAQVAVSEGQDRHCWFFDSFEGLPKPTEDDFDQGETGRHVRPLPRGSCLGTYEQVSRLLFDTMKLQRNVATLVKGWFQDTLSVTVDQMGSIALLRIDGDWYASTRCCLEHFYDEITPGGYVIVDDYFSCFGARRATDEFLRNRGIKAKLVSDGRGGCSFEKPSLSTQKLPNAIRDLKAA